MTGRTVIVGLLLLAGCSASSAPVLPAEAAAALSFVRKAQSPLPVQPVALWHATDVPGSLICGEIDAPPAQKRFRETLRFIYDGSHRSPVAQIEKHELVVGTSASTNAILAENRNIFDNLWADHCLPNAPVARRIAAWFAGTGEAPPPSAPISNAYIDAVLKNRR